MGGPRIPWDEARLRDIVERLKSAGLTLANVMIGGFPNAIYGRPGRDEEIDNVRESIRAAGRSGMPVIEYNFYAHRAMEGYYEETGPRRRRHDGLRLRPHQGPAAAAAGGRAHARRNVGQRHLFPQGGGAGGREGRSAAGAASQRSAGARQPRLGPDHGHARGMEAPHRDRAEPVQRHHLRLRRHPRNGRGPGRGLPLLRLARPHQPHALPQRARARAVREVHRGRSWTRARSTCSP